MNLLQRFQQLDAWLYQHQALWRGRPFVERELAWESDWPELAGFLRARTLEEAEADHNVPDLLDAPHPFPGWAGTARELSLIPDWSRSPDSTPPERLTRHVPGRKWEQITRFADVTLHQLPVTPEHWIDWCAGKGHLGRLLAWQSGQPVTCLEHDTALNQQGRELSRQCGVIAEHLAADVLDAQTWQRLGPGCSPVALHACGQLHMTLIEQGAAQGCTQLAVAPCCYNRIPTADYHPMSRAAAQAQLKLSRNDLGLPLQESVTAGQRVRRLRDQSMAWRLAFDLWQREGRGIDAYLHTPSRPESALNEGIAAYCRSFAAHHGLVIPEPSSWDDLEKLGWERLAQVRNLELVSGLFRRPLELWLMLDRALFLEEASYQVKIGKFCSASLTPRNFLLIAHKKS